MLKKILQFFQKDDIKATNGELTDVVGEQIQLLVSWPGSGYKTDSIRLSSLEPEEWTALKSLAKQSKEIFPVLSALVSRPLPSTCPFEKLEELKKECEENTDYEKLDTPEMSGLSSISFHVSQALKQQKASITLDCWVGEYFEGHTFVKPGVDLLEDIKEINNA